MINSPKYLFIIIAYLTYPSSSQEYLPRNNNGIPCKAVCQIYIDKEKLHGTKQGSNFSQQFQQQIQCKSHNPIQKRKDSPLILKVVFFFKNRPIHFHINSTSVVRPFKRNKLSFSSIEINKPFPAPVHSVSLVRFKFRCQLQMLPQIKCWLTLNVEASVIRVVRKLQITSPGRSLMNIRKNVGPNMDLKEHQH